jgi:hypothetical protein
VVSTSDSGSGITGSSLDEGTISCVTTVTSLREIFAQTNQAFHPSGVDKLVSDSAIGVNVFSAATGTACG